MPGFVAETIRWADPEQQWQGVAHLVIMQPSRELLGSKLIPFAIHPPAVAAHPSILSNYPMTRNCHSHLVRSASPCDGSCCCGLSDGLRHLAIGLGRAKRNRLKIHPHSPLKGGRLNIKRKAGV